MGKSKQQKESEALDLKRQRQQVDANEWMAKFSKELSRMTSERFTKEQSYLENEVDPLMKSLARQGFAPGEEKRLRAQSEEDVSRVWNQEGKNILGGMARMGFSPRGPAGALARVKQDLGRGRAESRVAGLRGIAQRGADVRRGMVGPMMQRAGLHNPEGPLSGVSMGRPTDITPAKQGPGFWGKFGGAMTKVAQSAVGAFNPLSGMSKVINRGGNG